MQTSKVKLLKSQVYRSVHLFTDGGCVPNPGAGAIALQICSESNQLLFEFSECIGQTTNNRAEYRALIKGLDLCAKYTRREVTCFMDSELVVKQMTGVYCLKNDDLRKLFEEAKVKEQFFMTVTYQHVSRKHQRIQYCDRLVNEAMQGRTRDKCLIDP